MKQVILTSIICLFVGILQAQITTNEQPYGLKGNVKIQRQNKIVLSLPDKTRIKQEDFVNDQQSGLVRYAYPIEVNYTLENSGVWQQLNDGSKIWRLTVKIPDALSTNTYYEKFWLPEGGKFFVYSEETRQSIGAITSEFIGGSKENPIKFATAIIYGENVVYEYYQSALVMDTPMISISRIDYGYRYVNNPYEEQHRGFGDANPLNININCPEGANWQNEKRAVARISVYTPFGSSWCSGALINNTKNDGIPYLLTACHCLPTWMDVETDNDASQWVFYWDYEHTGCNNSSVEPVHKTSLGSMLIANSVKGHISSTDFALFRLIQDPRNINGFTPYYLGWDRGSPISGGVGIHHPQGDVKKISTYAMVPQPNISRPFWNIIFCSGITEGGSSGSPLINSYSKIIGQLGGNDTPLGPGWKWYGRFDASWTGNGLINDRRKLQPWLDPINTNVLTLDGCGSGDIVNFINKNVNTDETITTCGNINLQNVTVTNNAKLILDAAGTTTINGPFEVQLGSELEIK